MNGSSTDCPECGAELVKRLGVLECSDCGYEAGTSEPVEQTPIPATQYPSRDPRTHRRSLGDLLSGVDPRKDAVPRASRQRR